MRRSVGSRTVGRLVSLLSLLTAVVVVPLIAAPTAAFAVAGCQQSGPVNGSWTVTVCLETPVAGATLTGEVVASAGVTRSASAPSIERLIFSLRGAYVLTTYEPVVGNSGSDYARYDILLPSAQFVDGAGALTVIARMAGGVESVAAGSDVTLANGVTTVPAAGGTWTPRGTATPAAGPYVLAAAGDGAGGRATSRQVSDLVNGWAPNSFLYLGDVYDKGTRTEFRNFYGAPDQLWGRFAGVTNPVMGNHEVLNDGYPWYWGGMARNYSYDVAGWHVVALDSTTQFDQVAPGTPQFEWLRADLERSTAACTMVVSHHPRWSIGTYGEVRLQDQWKLLADRGVDIVLNGHEHNYQRWTPMNGDGVAAAGGPTQIIAGGGGHGLSSFTKTDSRVAYAIDSTSGSAAYGALRMELTSSAAAFSYVGADSVTRDQGTVTCSPHIAPPPPPPPLPSGEVIFADDFESGGLSSWTSVTGLTVAQSPTFAGAWAARATSASGATRAAWARRAITARNEIYVRTRVNVLSQGGNFACVLKVRHATNVIIDLCIDWGGSLYSWNYTAATKKASATKVLPGSGWRDLQMRVKVDPAGGPGETEVWLDGVRLADLSGPAALGTAQVAGVQIGGNETTKVYDIALDNVTASAGFISDVAPSPTATATATATPTATVSPTPTATVEPTPTATVSPTPTETATTPPPPPPPAPPMFSDGFESGTLASWTTVKGLTVSSTAFAGAYGARATSTGSGAGSYARKTLPSPLTDVYFRTRLRVLSQGASVACVLKFRAGSGMVTDLCLDNGGSLYSWNYLTRLKTSSAVRILPGSAWHDVQMRVVIAGTASRTEVWLNGAPVPELTTTTNLGTAAVSSVQLGGNETGKTYDLAFDDVAVASTYLR